MKGGWKGGCSARRRGRTDFGEDLKLLSYKGFQNSKVLEWRPFSGDRGNLLRGDRGSGTVGRPRREGRIQAERPSIPGHAAVRRDEEDAGGWTQLPGASEPLLLFFLQHPHGPTRAEIEVERGDERRGGGGGGGGSRG
ncbi:unnamed protein product [Pleuronectes platessa]|uniref:Uncharacterized protein n=1 Tax=Pleuronectes platessa TaxID=8262 RepID=A0A9N7U7L3_PLEPL|nr:unnamed protein product [Pleuronectes platessa]